jgi:hypothetical protein
LHGEPWPCPPPWHARTLAVNRRALIPALPFGAKTAEMVMIGTNRVAANAICLARSGRRGQ